MLNHAGSRNKTRYSCITFSYICSAYDIDRARDPTKMLLSKVNRGAEFYTKKSTSSVFNIYRLCFYLKNVTFIRLLERFYKNIFPSLTRNPWRVMSCHPLPSERGNITFQGTGTYILAYYPRSHVLNV